MAYYKNLYAKALFDDEIVNMTQSESIYLTVKFLYRNYIFILTQAF